MSNATAVFFPAVLALVIVGAFIQLYRVRGKGRAENRNSLRSKKGPSLWVKVFSLSASIGLPVYLIGLMSGFTQAPKMCGVESGKGPSNRPDSITETLFPLSRVCKWTDGTIVDLVPSWVNPVLFVCAAGFVLCAAMSIWTVIKNKKEPAHE
ncbi:hypothetical protein OHT20_13750 [Streptomyces caniferus]|uniref:Uncharacterized protein n=1 Tax=Streptomyces caniferus TaxID=285557 RepID=A0ABZ1VLL5_9ACTN|nr:hypothetical protein [Streptomyces caniferus]